MGPPAIAIALDQAEAAFGMALANRARAKGISPTRAGRDVPRRIDDLLDRYDARTLTFAPTHCQRSQGHACAGVSGVTIAQIAKQPLILRDRPAARGSPALTC